MSGQVWKFHSNGRFPVLLRMDAEDVEAITNGEPSTGERWLIKGDYWKFLEINLDDPARVVTGPTTIDEEAVIGG